MPYPICKCNGTNITTTIATSTTEHKCVPYTQCETDADCPNGMCWALGLFSVCKCGLKTTTITTTKTTTSISETKCTHWASCENDFECNGGKCTDIMGAGKQ